MNAHASQSTNTVCWILFSMLLRLCFGRLWCSTCSTSTSLTVDHCFCHVEHFFPSKQTHIPPNATYTRARAHTPAVSKHVRHAKSEYSFRNCCVSWFQYDPVHIDIRLCSDNGGVSISRFVCELFTFYGIHSLDSIVTALRYCVTAQKG